MAVFYACLSQSVLAITATLQPLQSNDRSLPRLLLQRPPPPACFPNPSYCSRAWRFHLNYFSSSILSIYPNQLNILLHTTSLILIKRRRPHNPSGGFPSHYTSICSFLGQISKFSSTVIYYAWKLRCYSHSENDQNPAF